VPRDTGRWRLRQGPEWGGPATAVAGVSMEPRPLASGSGRWTVAQWAAAVPRTAAVACRAVVARWTVAQRVVAMVVAVRWAAAARQTVARRAAVLRVRNFCKVAHESTDATST
jgi:hypothetical protein